MASYEVVKTAKIYGSFEGFNDEVLFKLVDGTYLIQDQYKYWYHYAYSPQVNLLRSGGQLYLQVVGQTETVPVRQINDVLESQIDGDFEGWEGETAYQLTNGQVWKQATYSYEYVYAYMPEVLIYRASGGHKIQVEGTSIEVTRVK